MTTNQFQQNISVGLADGFMPINRKEEEEEKVVPEKCGLGEV